MDELSRSDKKLSGECQKAGKVHTQTHIQRYVCVCADMLIFDTTYLL